MSTFVVTISTPDGTGAPRMAALYATALRRAGHRVIVACGRLPGDPDAPGPMEDDFAAADLEARTVPGLERRYHRGAVRDLASLAGVEDARAIIAFQFRDQMTALLAARRSGVPAVISAQNRHAFWGSWPVRTAKTAIFARALRSHAALVIATSEAVRREVAGFGVDPARTCVLPNAIDVQGFPCDDDPARTRELRQEFGAGDDGLLLLNVGRIDVQKGQIDLLHAFRDASAGGPALRLVLVGDVTTTQSRRMGAYHRELVRFVDDHHLAEAVTFAGWRDDVPALLAASDVYVHSARWEGWPLAVMEALAAGCPTIFTDCSGRPDAFEDGREGIIVPTGDPPALARAIATAASMTSEARTAMGRAGRSYAERHYDISVVGPRFVEMVESVR